jgi:hypothetical protein
MMMKKQTMIKKKKQVEKENCMKAGLEGGDEAAASP